VAQWVKRMSEIKLVPGYGEVDMKNPESIRSYVRHSLALDEPTIAGLKRLEMLNEIAGSLPQAKAVRDQGLKLVDGAAAAAELRRRAEQDSKQS
jgi:hypothetical protein